MERGSSISFSAVLATLLLEKRQVSARDIINFNSKIASIYDVEIIDDDIQHLFVCVEHDANFNFKLKDNLDYDSLIFDGVTVRSFLISNAISDFVKVDDSVKCTSNMNRRVYKILQRKLLNNFSLKKA